MGIVVINWLWVQFSIYSYKYKQLCSCFKMSICFVIYVYQSGAVEDYTHQSQTQSFWVAKAFKDYLTYLLLLCTTLISTCHVLLLMLTYISTCHVLLLMLTYISTCHVLPLMLTYISTCHVLLLMLTYISTCHVLLLMLTYISTCHVLLLMWLYPCRISYSFLHGLGTSYKGELPPQT